MSVDANRNQKNSIRAGLVLGGVQVVGALLLTLAHQVGWIDSETTTRGVMVLIGLMLMVIGNRMPKLHEGPPSQTVGQAVVRQSISRVGGWALMFAGLIWTGLWTFSPRDAAQAGSIAAVGAAMLVLGIHAFWRYRSGRAP